MCIMSSMTKITEKVLKDLGFKQNEDQYYYLEGFETEHLVVNLYDDDNCIMGVNHVRETLFFVWNIKNLEELNNIYLQLTKIGIVTREYVKKLIEEDSQIKELRSQLKDYVENNPSVNPVRSEEVHEIINMISKRELEIKRVYRVHTANT